MNIADQAMKERLLKLKSLVEAGERPVAIMNELVRERSAIKPGMKVVIVAVEQQEPVNFDDQIIENWCFWLDVEAHIEHNIEISPSFGNVTSATSAIMPYFDSINNGRIAFDLDDNPLLAKA